MVHSQLVHSILCLSLCLLPLIHAFPQPTPTAALQGRAVNCNAVNSALSILKILGPPASTFCCSYLGIPATTTSTVLGPTGTTTITTSTETTIVTSRNCPMPGPSKRDVFDIELERRAVPAALTRFGAAQLSSGCRCLDLAPKTTKLTTVTPVTQVTISVAATTTICTTCAPPGGVCDLFRPDLCCDGVCFQNAFTTTCV